MADFYPVYIALRDTMLRAAPNLKIGKDALGEFTANVPMDIMASKDPIWFGSVRLSQANVAYHLPPLAMKEGRDIVVPERLKKYAQTKTCFIFYDVDPDLFAELEALTRQAAQGFKALAA
jgi:hypothetical protein